MNPPLSAAIPALGQDTAARIPPRRALLLVDANLSAHPALDPALERYRKLVLTHFRYDLQRVSENSDISPTQLRALLNKHHATDGIRGAFFIGGFRMPTFRGAAGDVSAFPEYYQDLDGDVRDEDGDGILDFYDPWDGRGDRQPLKIWLAVLRPYETSVTGAPGVDDLIRYFHRVNRSMEVSPDRPQRRAVIFTSRDWSDVTYLVKALQPRFTISLFGGADEVPLTPSIVDFKRAGRITAEILFIFAHSGPSQHFLDAPAHPGNIIAAGELDSPGPTRLEDLPVRSRLAVIWGCHAMDLEGIRPINGRFLANSYLFTRGFRTQTVLGSARSIGLEALPVLVARLQETPLCDAWLAYQNHVYQEEYLRAWLGVRRVWEKERLRFNWSYLMYGNPFLRFAPR